MKITYFNCPSPKTFGDVSLPIDIEFLSYQPDFSAMEQVAAKYEQYKNILIVGHGGSITSFNGLYTALEHKATKLAYFLSTTDPDDIAWLKKQLSPDNTLVVAISKSGETVTQLEALSQFLDFPLLVIAGENSPLAEIANKLDAELVVHPTIGGRYTGFTEVALLPAVLCGFDAKAIFEAGRAWHNKFNEDNEAWQAASVLAQLEDQGVVDVFLPFYSHGLIGMGNLIVQLCHESFGKSGRGQTYFVHESPESQHHTNQRFLGGRQNIAGVIVSTEKFLHNGTVSFPENLENITLKQESLGALQGLELAKSMQYEMEGTLEDATGIGLPVIHMALAEKTESELGQFLAFWQMYAVYASILRGVNPFDQPAVENSKQISFHKRLAAKN